MRYWIPFSFLVLGACSANGEAVKEVTPEVYLSDINGCWSDQSGQIASFLVIADSENGGIPYPISSKCDVQTDIYPPGKGFLNYLNALYVLGDNGLLESKSLYPKKLVSNAITHSPLPDTGDRIYYFEGKFTTTQKNQQTFHTISTVSSFIDTGLTFGEFVEIEPAERSNIAKQYSTSLVPRKQN
ncbi:MAG: hypothetical protein ABJO01_10775 [Parasphingorhabdus sp.]|uniref:hypothetical protein n=1 Tax=Parasphingorhabdus sp. TaxID=2709688 RepID=UPI0032973F81